jgi:hypothetical protein
MLSNASPYSAPNLPSTHASFRDQKINRLSQENTAQLNRIVQKICSAEGKRWQQIKDYAALKTVADKKPPSMIIKSEILFISMILGIALLAPNFAPAAILATFALVIGMYGRYKNEIASIETAKQLEAKAIHTLEQENTLERTLPQRIKQLEHAYSAEQRQLENALQRIQLLEEREKSGGSECPRLEN